MARRLEKNENDNIVFREFVFDVDEDDISHPIEGNAELYKKDGNLVNEEDRSPSWLDAIINDLGVNNERYEEEVKVTIINPDDNLESGSYTFRFLASDGLQEVERLVTLTVD